MFKSRAFIIIFVFWHITTLCDNNAEKILDLIKQFLPENPIVVEAGAHHGEDTLKMSFCWPEGMIYAFEPLPSSYSKLKKAVQARPNVECFSYALSNTTGSANFYVDSDPKGDNGASSLCPPGGILQHIYAREPISVECITLDEWAHLQNISHIDFLWLDLEGGELTALKAAPVILKTVSAIYLEVNLTELWIGIPLYPEVKEWLEKHHFKEIWKWIVRPGRQANVLFIHENIQLQNKEF